MIHAQFIFTKNVALLLQFIFSSGYYCTMGEAYRTHEQALWNVKHHIGILNSQHCDRLAIDLNLFDANCKYLGDKADYEKIGAYWEKLHPKNRWGGRWMHRVDLDHFEMEEL